MVRRLFLALVLVVGAGALYFSFSDDAQQAAKLRAGEALGDIAAERMAEAIGAQEGQHERSADLINVPIEVVELNDFIYQAKGVGNTHLIATSEGHVIFDNGLVTQAAKQKRLLDEARGDAPVTHVILSHSHQDHVGGTTFWVEDGTEIVTHFEFPEEQRYLRELGVYLHDRNRILFPWLPEGPPRPGPRSTTATSSRRSWCATASPCASSWAACASRSCRRRAPRAPTTSASGSPTMGSSSAVTSSARSSRSSRTSSRCAARRCESRSSTSSRSTP